MKRAKEWLRLAHKAERLAVVKAGAFAHVAYYALVTIEAHGNYRYAAAVLLIVALFGHEEA